MSKITITNPNYKDLVNLVINSSSENSQKALDLLKGMVKYLEFSDIGAKNILESLKEVATCLTIYNKESKKQVALEAINLIKELYKKKNVSIYATLEEISKVVIIDEVGILSNNTLTSLCTLGPPFDNTYVISSSLMTIAVEAKNTKVALSALDSFDRMSDLYEENLHFNLGKVWRVFCKSKNLAIKHSAFLNLVKRKFFENRNLTDYRIFRSEILFGLESYEKAGDSYK